MIEQKAIVILSTDEYKRLVKQDERIATVERLFRKDGFLSVEDVKIILDIKGTAESEGGENETV